MSNNVKLQVLLRAVDQASRPFKSIRTASRSLSGDIRETQKSLRELNGHASRIEGFRKTSAQLAVTGHALEKARQEAEALATQFKNTERPTRAQAKVLESAKRAAEDLQAKYNRLTDSVKRQQRELAVVGINTRNLARDEQGLKNRISETTAQLNRQRDALARVSAQQAKLNAVKQRYQEASYLKVGENFELMGTGFTELNEDPGAQTTSKKYINDKSSTSSITSYEGEHGFTADQIPSEKVIKDLVSIGKERKTGADAEREFVRVDLDEKVEGDTTGTVFKARMFTVAAEISSFSDNDGELQVEGTLHDKGDPVMGKFDTKTKTFTPDSATE